MNDSTININTKKEYPVATLITIVLIIAKVWGGADISWLFCFAPVLICLGITLLLIIIFIIVARIAYR